MYTRTLTLLITTSDCHTVIQITSTSTLQMTKCGKKSKNAKGAMDDLGLDYVEAEGEAAFYGPKLDIQTRRLPWVTMKLCQLSNLLHTSKRFDLSYVGQDGEEHRPVMIHRDIVGTMKD